MVSIRHRHAAEHAVGLRAGDLRHCTWRTWTSASSPACTASTLGFCVDVGLGGVDDFIRLLRHQGVENSRARITHRRHRWLVHEPGTAAVVRVVRMLGVVAKVDPGSARAMDQPPARGWARDDLRRIYCRAFSGDFLWKNLRH